MICIFQSDDAICAFHLILDQICSSLEIRHLIITYLA